MRDIKDIKEAVMAKIFFISAFASVTAIGLIVGFLLIGGLPAIFEIGFRDFFLGRVWAPMNIPSRFGLLPMIAGSFYITFGAVLIGMPVGIFTAIFLAYYCPKKIYVFVKPVVNLLAGIPSVVYGFFGMMVLIPIIRSFSIATTGGGAGASILTASILLGIMILPTVIAISESAIRVAPREYYEGALALGASKTRSIFFVIVPAAKSGILASVILGIGRAVGETMAVVMVAGNQARLPEMPIGFLRGGRSLTANIVIEMAYAADTHRQALIASGVVLFIFIFLINVLFTRFSGKERKRDKKAK